MENRKKLFAGIALIIAFIVWTILIQSVDVQTGAEDEEEIELSMEIKHS